MLIGEFVYLNNDIILLNRFLTIYVFAFSFFEYLNF